MKEFTSGFGRACAAVLAASLLSSASASAAETGDDTTWVNITRWDNAHLYQGWSAQEILGEEVYGRGGEVIGTVEDFVIGRDGRIKKVVVEGGGFLDIGDSHIAVPWERTRRVATTSLTVPVTEENLDSFGIFENVDDVPPEPENFRLREMLGDYVTADNIGYGSVKDVIFSQDGKLEAVVVKPAYGYKYTPKPVTLPFYADRYEPYQPYYAVPYSVQELQELRPFDYSRID